MKSIRKVVTLPHKIEDVWTALTSPEALAEWLMPNTFSEAAVGARFRFQFDPEPLCLNGIVECQVIAVDPPHSMTWSWQNGPVKHRKAAPPSMEVEWKLEAVPAGTKITLTQRGLQGQPWIIPFAMSFGWSAYLKKMLPRVLRNTHSGVFQPGAIPMKERLYKAKDLPPEVTK